jgi:hypothetical protein
MVLESNVYGVKTSLWCPYSGYGVGGQQVWCKCMVMVLARKVIVTYLRYPYSGYGVGGQQSWCKCMVMV